MIIYVFILLIIIFYIFYSKNDKINNYINKNKQLNSKYIDYSDVTYKNRHTNLYNEQNKTLISNLIKGNNKNCQKDILTQYDCFINNCDLCPVGSFKQCSNNYSYKTYPPNIKCNCNINYELCNNKYSQSCLLKNHKWSVWKDINKIEYPKSCPRVNMWNSKKTFFDLI